MKEVVIEKIIGIELILSSAHLINFNHRFECQLTLLPILLASFLFNDGLQVYELLLLLFDLAWRAADGLGHFRSVRLVALLLGDLLN